MPRTIKIAVIGSGLAGLTAAYLLSGSSSKDVEFEVHIFEKSSTLGMDSSSISIPVPGEQDFRCDVPMRSFQGGYYTQLIRLYRHLGIQLRKTDFSYSFSRLIPRNGAPRRQITADMIYNGDSGRGGVSMPSYLKKQKQKNVPAFKILSNAYVYVLFLSVPLFRPQEIEEMTFRTWSTMTIPRGFIARTLMLDQAWMLFTRDVLLPLFSAVCTAPENSVYDHPVEEFLDYIWLTLGYHHFVALNGVQEVVSKLTSGVRHIHLSSPISSIYLDSDDPTTSSLRVSTDSGTQVYSGFHHLVFATQANRAVPLLESFGSSLPPYAKAKRHAVQQTIACLRHFSYCSTLVVNHTDSSLVPDDSQDERDLNLIYQDRSIISKDSSEKQTGCCSLPPSYTMATHVLTAPEGYRAAHLPTVYQTTNPIVEPRESRILSVAKLERAVLTVHSKRALKGLHVEYGRKWWQSASQGKSRLGHLQGARPFNEPTRSPGIWICGSYAYSGIPLLEGCVVSAQNVVKQGIWESEGIHQRIPW